MKTHLKSSVSLAAVGALVATEQASAAIDELVVTARKRSENLQDIPLSVQAFGAEDIAKQGIKSLEDYARLIPSLTYSAWIPGSSVVVFRGVTTSADSFGGSSSSAMYLNNMPVTVQGQNPEILMVDMERIEAVSGPQPTTYGASSQSGTIKFVTAKPNMSEMEGFIDVSLSGMEEGESSYDINGAVNIPIVEDKFAVRIAAYQAKEGGYVDNIAGSSLDTHDYSGVFDNGFGTAAFGGSDLAAAGISRVSTSNAAVAEDDVGDVEYTGARLTATLQLNDNWAVTGMAAFQNIDVDGVASYNPQFGDLNQIRFHKETKKDDWWAATFDIEGDLGFADFTSSTGYMHREVVYDLDSSVYLHQFGGVGGLAYHAYDVANGTFYVAGAYAVYTTGISNWTPFPHDGSGIAASYVRATEVTDQISRMFDDDESERWSQEFRLTSKDDGSRVNWMVGAFYEKYEDEFTFRSILDNGFADSLAGYLISYLYATGRAVQNEDVNTYYSVGVSEEEQWAVFGELSVDLTDKFNVLVGARYYNIEQQYSYLSFQGDGFVVNSCAEDEFGACIVGTAPTLENPLGGIAASVDSEETGVSPVLTLTYQWNDDVMTYFTRSEGFRAGGVNLLKPSSTLSPNYNSDTLTNYEIGLKSTLWDGRARFNAAVYHMIWDEIQIRISDPTLAIGYSQVNVNAGEAEITGFETNFEVEVTDSFTIDGALSYTDAEITEGAVASGITLVGAGEELPLSPDLSVNIGAEYSFPVSNLDSDGYIRFDYSYVDEQTNGTSGSLLLTSQDLIRPGIATQGDYDQASLKLGVTNDSWSASIGVTNLWDERANTFQPPRFGDGRRYTLRPREFTVNFRKNF